MDYEKELQFAIRDGLRDGLKLQLGRTYDNPLEKVIKGVLGEQEGAFRKLLTDAVTSAAGDEGFRETIRREVRGQLAKQLVKSFGGEMEKQVNLLKSDPVTRARITIAIEEIVKERATK